MESSRPVIWSDKKDMEEVQRIREALAGGKPVLSEAQVGLIRQHTTFLGEDGEAVMREIQEDATKTGRLPADIARVIEKYCKDLARKVSLRELSNDLEKDKEQERLLQLESMQAEVSKYAAAKAKGNMADLMRVKESLPAQLRKYLEDIKADEEEGLSSVTIQKWRMAALDLTNDAMEYLEGMGRNVGSAPEGVLGPLRRGMGKVATLSEAVTKGVQETDKEGLRDLARKLGAVKKELMAMGRDMMVNQPAAMASEAHELVSEVGEAIKASQKIIKAALRGLGVASNISETSSLGAPPHLSPGRPISSVAAADAYTCRAE
jgi:predicted transcriptional regulator with HTH domain